MLVDFVRESCRAKYLGRVREGKHAILLGRYSGGAGARLLFAVLQLADHHSMIMPSHGVCGLSCHMARNWQGPVLNFCVIVIACLKSSGRVLSCSAGYGAAMAALSPLLAGVPASGTPLLPVSALLK